MAFEHGVSFYTKGIVTFEIFFPETCTDCGHCNYCYKPSSDDMKRCKCSLTQEYIYQPMIGRGRLCPIVFENEKE
jgi:ribosomal protein S27E